MRLRVLVLLALLIPCLGAQAQKPNIVCFGDSLTAGYGAPAGASYPDNLRKQLGDSATILNQGISGNTTKDGLARVGAVLRAHPSIVLLELGANDGLRGFPVADIRRNLTRIIEDLQRQHIRILLLGIKLPPNLGPDYVHSFDALFPELARQYKLPLVPFLLDNVWDHPELLSPDNLHPNAAGYRVVEQNVLPYLQPMLTRPAR